jgi:hypothetical protein
MPFHSDPVTGAVRKNTHTPARSPPGRMVQRWQVRLVETRLVRGIASSLNSAMFALSPRTDRGSPSGQR